MATCARAGHAYSPDRQYFALVERHNNREHLCVYDAGDRYNLVRVSASVARQPVKPSNPGTPSLRSPLP